MGEVWKESVLNCGVGKGKPAHLGRNAGRMVQSGLSYCFCDQWDIAGFTDGTILEVVCFCRVHGDWLLDWETEDAFALVFV